MSINHHTSHWISKALNPSQRISFHLKPGVSPYDPHIQQVLLLFPYSRDTERNIRYGSPHDLHTVSKVRYKEELNFVNWIWKKKKKLKMERLMMKVSIESERARVDKSNCYMKVLFVVELVCHLWELRCQQDWPHFWKNTSESAYFARAICVLSTQPNNHLEIA